MKVKLVYIVICMLLCACKSTVKEPGSEENVVSLFNGKNLDKWTGDSRIWSVEDGSIVGRTTDENKIEKNTFLIYEDSFADFELSFSYKIIGGNSGVQYRSKVIDNDLFVVGGYQADMEAGFNYSGILYEEKGRGIIAKRGEKITIAEDGKKAIEQFVKSEEIQAIIKQEQWNTYKIVAKGNQLQHFINGHKTIDVTDNQLDKKSDAGILALQVHAGPNMVVYYTNIELKPILK